MNRFQGQMYAIFHTTPKHLKSIIERENGRSGLKLAIRVEPHGSGAMSFVSGEIQSVMLVIGAVANEGENCLYKAECL